MAEAKARTGYIYIWVYDIDPAHEDAFLHAYGPGGDWCTLFNSASGYIRTELYRGRQTPHRFVTIDHWESAEAWERLRAERSDAFEAIDALERDHEYLLRGGVFTPDLIEKWIEYKREAEIDPVRLRPHPAEFELYYDV